MPTPPKACDVRFENAEQVIAAIDKTLARIAKLKQAAYFADKKADELLAKSAKHELYSEKQRKLASNAQSCRDRAERKRKRAQKIEANYLPRLKGRLATIQTMILPGVDIPVSIPQ